MEKSAGQQFFSSLLEELSFGILSTDGDLIRPRHIFAEIRNAETAFTLRVLAFRVNDLGIDENELGLGIFLESDINDGDTPANTDLRGSEPDAVSRVHRLEHVLNKFFELLVEYGDRFRGLFEDRIAELHDGIDHQ